VEKAADDPLLVQRAGELAVTVRAAETLPADAPGGNGCGRGERAAGRWTHSRAERASIACAIARPRPTRPRWTPRRPCSSWAAPAARIGLNLDRHWRNARTHTRCTTRSAGLPHIEAGGR
jgi:hypothetical protein